MRHIWTIGLLATLVLVMFVWSGALAEEKTAEGTVRIGGIWTVDDIDSDEDGAKGTEYDSTSDRNASWDLGGNISLRNGGITLDADARYKVGDDQEYNAELSLMRILTYKTSYNRLYHRLDHDSLENLEAHIYSNSGTGLFLDLDGDGVNDKNEEVIGSASVYHTDLGAGDDYYVTRSEWENHLVFHIPQFPALTIGFDHRMEKRQGMEQARTMSKCSSCHVVGDSKDIHELTNDYVPKVSLRLGSVSVEYSYLHREFNDKSEEMEMNYNALATSNLAFYNRLQFSSDEGSLPYAETPDSQKDTHTVKARWDLNRDNVITAAFVHSKSTNLSADGSYDPLYGDFGDNLELDSTAVMAKWHNRFSRSLSFTLKGKYQTLDNDSVYVDVNDRVNIYTDGLTLGEGYNTTNPEVDTGYWDFTRLSGYDMDIVTLGFDMVWRLNHRFTLRGEYEFQYEDRENARAHEVPVNTKEHTFKLAGDWRINHSLKMDFGYKLVMVDDPYAYLKATCTPYSSFGDYGGPPGDLYTWDRSYRPTIYEPRTGVRSNQPSQVHEFTFKASWLPMHMVSTSWHAKYRSAVNDEVSGFDWQQDLFTAGLHVVLTPSEKTAFNVGYNYFYDKYESMYCVAIYDG